MSFPSVLPQGQLGWTRVSPIQLTNDAPLHGSAPLCRSWRLAGSGDVTAVAVLLTGGVLAVTPAPEGGGSSPSLETPGGCDVGKGSTAGFEAGEPALRQLRLQGPPYCRLRGCGGRRAEAASVAPRLLTATAGGTVAGASLLGLAREDGHGRRRRGGRAAFYHRRRPRQQWMRRRGTVDAVRGGPSVEGVAVMGMKGKSGRSLAELTCMDKRAGASSAASEASFATAELVFTLGTAGACRARASQAVPPNYDDSA